MLVGVNLAGILGDAETWFGARSGVDWANSASYPQWDGK